MATIQELLRELEQESQTTRRALERIPEARLDWQPHAKSLSMGQLAMHVATLPGAIAEISTHPTFDVDAPIPRPGASSVAELLTALDDSVARAKDVLGRMSDDDLGSLWRAVKGGKELFALPRAAVFRSVLFNHWYHHRGQLTVYLRLAGALVPGLYGPSADESLFLG